FLEQRQGDARVLGQEHSQQVLRQEFRLPLFRSQVLGGNQSFARLYSQAIEAHGTPFTRKGNHHYETAKRRPLWSRRWRTSAAWFIRLDLENWLGVWGR